MKNRSFGTYGLIFVLGSFVTVLAFAASWHRRYQEVEELQEAIEKKAGDKLKKTGANLTAGLQKVMKDHPDRFKSQKAAKLLKKVDGELHKFEPTASR